MKPRWLTAHLKSGKKIDDFPDRFSGGVSAFSVQATDCAFFFCGLPAATGPVLLS
jgi:hypothetical protein